MKCIVCGKESKNSVCAECYSRRHELIKINIITITVCPRCGFYKISGKWKKISFEEALEKSIEKSIEIHPDFVIEDASIDYKDNSSGILKVTGKLWGDKIKIEKYFKIKVNKVLCRKCSLISGGYYESIIQIRADRISEKEVREIQEIVKTTLENEEENLKAFVTKVVEKKKGFDIYLGGRDIGKKVSRKLAERFGCKITESKKISGKKDGRDIHRFTYLVRFPDYKVGDVVVENKKLIYVTNVKYKKGIRLPDLKVVNLKDCNLAVKSNEIKEGIAVNSDDFAIEVLDPEKGEIILAEKCGNIKTGDKTYILKYDEKIYAVPDYVVKSTIKSTKPKKSDNP